jgi:hypothetical protein
MVCSKVHIIHVGNMANKGTQALLMSNVSVIGEVIARATTFPLRHSKSFQN